MVRTSKFKLLHRLAELVSLDCLTQTLELAYLLRRLAVRQAEERIVLLRVMERADLVRPYHHILIGFVLCVESVR